MQKVRKSVKIVYNNFWHVVKLHGFWRKEGKASISILEFTSGCLTFGEWLHFPVSQCLHGQINDGLHLPGSSWVLNELMCVQCLEKHLVYGHSLKSNCLSYSHTQRKGTFLTGNISKYSLVSLSRGLDKSLCNDIHLVNISSFLWYFIYYSLPAAWKTVGSPNALGSRCPVLSLPPCPCCLPRLPNPEKDHLQQDPG